MSLTDKIKTRAFELGFDLVGVSPAQPAKTADFYADWLARGFAGEMGYLHRHLEKRRDPRKLLPGARSIISLGINYFTFNIPEEIKQDASRGIISRYAWGKDYHDIIQRKLKRLLRFIKSEDREIHGKAYVDTGPILEREAANNSSLGFIGKNSNLINPEFGSWLFLAEILVDIELEYHQSPVKSRCGKCARCLDACPTGALVAPYTLDSRRCISYLTIELKDSIPRGLRPLMGNHIFGCDVCQDVCPWNRKAKPTKERGFWPEADDKFTASRFSYSAVAPDLLSLLGLGEAEFRLRFKNSPIKRAKRRGFLRNVAVAMGNWGLREQKPPPAVLKRARNDAEPLIQEHAAWAVDVLEGKIT
ncbi:MAG: tRNA epoxyqueuosine(34) reductase QueG [Candidatus Poribacteria bacterium]